QLGEVTLAAAGTVDWKEGYDLKAQIPAVSLADVQTLASLDLPENLPVDPASPFELTTQVTGELDSPKARGRLANVDPIQVDKLSLATVWADFVLPLEKFRLKQFELTELRVVPDAGGLVLAQGQADLSDLETLEFELTGQADLPVDAFTQLYGVALPADMVLGSLSAELEAAGNLDNQTAVAQWQLSDSSFPGQGTLTLADQVVTAENTQLQVFGGTVAAQAVAQLDNGDWQATVLTDQVPIEQFTPQAQGLLRAELDAAGNLNDLDLAKIQAGGRAAIANAQVLIPNTNQPVLAPGDWTTDFRWQGDRVVVDSFNAPGLQADGTIGVDFNQPIPIGELDLNVVLEQYDLGPLNTLTPQTVNDYGQLAGLTSFNGRLTGTIDNPSLAGNARLDELALNGFVFESLSGPMTFSLTDGGALDLTGGQDRIQLALDSRFWPTVFEVRNQEFVAQGYGEGRQLHADITQLPLDKLNVRPVAGFGTVAGVLDATIDANLADFANPMAMGEITLENPSLAPIDAQQFAARFRYGNNTATIDQGELLLGDSRYSLTGRASLVPQLQYNGNVTIEEGRIEDLVALVEKLDLSTLGLEDFATPEGTAADLAVPPIALPAGTLLEQIVALEDFLASLPDVTEANNGGFFVPDLTDLSGGFSGTIGFEGDSLALSDASVEFNLEGDSWEWGPYAPPNEFLVQGNIQTLQLEIQPSFITAGDTRIDLSGSGDLDQLTGQLQVTNLPVELAQSIYPLPVAVAGDLGLVTNFSGSLADPIVQGRAVIIDPQINNYPLEEIGANFTYRNATLDLASEVAIEPDDDPITLTGQATYALPFMAQQPSNRLALKAVVPDDSFDLINTLSQDQVRWEQGQGNIVVQVDGTLERPIISGNVRLRDGIIGSDLLETPITNLNGDIEFDLAQLTIPNLQANLGDGQLQVTGQLPIWPFGFPLAAQPVSSNKNRRAKQTEQQTTAPNRLVISLDQLPIDYSGILQAMFDGKVYVDGSVLLPVIGGDLEISRGRVQALDLLSFVGAIELPTESTVDQADLYQADFFGEEEQEEQEAEKKAVGFVDFITLKDFSIVLTDRLSVAGRFLGQPLFDVRAAGKMAVNGPLKNLQPEGEFELQSGWINLFSNQFRLDANQPNTAKFAGELDPVVDVVMKTRVRETDVTRVPAAADGIVGAEVDDTTTVDSVGDVQFINVEAVAKGQASQLTKNLKLTSNPSYPQDTLLVLLGSNVVGLLVNFKFFVSWLACP
ncbi:MAG: translocation/assembly module TamB domain-containing protein, partial [Cyanobacteria bacterium J06642_11]